MTNVADLQLYKPDSLGEPILAFYARKPPHYAVYGIRRKVRVHFADEKEEADRQRKLLSQLAPLRGEIDGLIDGWREGSSHSFFGLENRAHLRSKADRYERRVGDALVVAIEHDLPSAIATLNSIKLDIINERTAWARFEYLIAAFSTALVMMFLALLVAGTFPIGETEDGKDRKIWAMIVLLAFLVVAGAATFLAGRGKPQPGTLAAAGAPAEDQEVAGEKPAQASGDRPPAPWLTAGLLFLLLAIPIFGVFVQPSFSHTDDPGPFREQIDLWRAATSGAVGAFFSIAVGIRGRTVLPDLLRTSNIVDAALRITIGFIAGAVLLALLKLEVVSISIGEESLASPDTATLAVVVIGFFAGFSERMVPDLLEKAKASTGGSTAAIPPTSVPPSPPSPPSPPPPAPAGGDAVAPVTIGDPIAAPVDPGADEEAAPPLDADTRVADPPVPPDPDADIAGRPPGGETPR